MKKTLCFMGLGIFLSSSLAQSSGQDIYLQKKENVGLIDSYKSLSLQGAIESGLRANLDQKVRNENKEILNLNFKDTKEEFWIPKLSLSIQTNEQLIGTLKSGDKNDGKTSQVPSGVISLGFEDYTVFNWGKDYLQYLNDKQEYNREVQVLNEKRRDLKHDIIIAFSELVRTKNSEKIAKDRLRHASFIYRHNKEKATVKKINKQQYYQARAEYLLAQEDFHNSKNEAALADERMAELLADNVGTRYVLKNEIFFHKFRLGFNEAISLAKKNNPEILNTGLEIDLAKRSEEIARREDLPLPKFNLKLGGYQSVFSDGSHDTDYVTGTNNNNIELVASVNATWTITGKNGLLNQRRRELAKRNKYVAMRRRDATQRGVESFIRQSFRSIQNLENQMKIIEAQIPTLQKSFDSAMENYLSKRTSYNDYHLALEELIHSQKNLEKTKYLHTKSKVNLARVIGLEDFPGENFESLGKERKK